MMRKEFQLQEVIFRENEHQMWMYSICEGSVDIYAGYGTEGEKKLTTLTAGQFFGEIGMISVLPRTATAVAAEVHVVLEQISNEDFEEYLKKHPENLQPIMSNVSTRIRNLTEDLSVITQMTNEVLHMRECDTSGTGWLTASIHKLLEKLRSKNVFCDEYIVMRRRMQALSGVTPPVMRLNAGDVIFRAGDPSDCMFVIYDGNVGIYSDYRTDNEKLLTTLHAEDTFGEMGILDDMPRSATAVCLTDCALLVVKPENFMAFFQQKPMKILQILMQMCLQLRNLTETYLEVCKALEEMPALDETNFREVETFAKLEQIRQTQLCAGLYDISCCRDCWYDHF